MLKRIENLFLMKYRETSFIILLKSKTLMYTDLFLLLLISIFLVVENVIVHRSVTDPLNIILTLLLISLVSSLLLLKSGKYNLAANVTVIFATLVVIGYALTGSMKYNSGIITASYHTILFIIFCSLFCKRYMLVIITLMVMTGTVSSFLTTDLLPRGEAITAMANYSFLAIVVFLLSYLLLQINERTFRRLQEQYESIKQLLQSVQNVASDLDESSSKMSTTAAEFSINAQNQASSAEEVTATIEEISSGIENVADSASEQQQSMNNLSSRIDELSDTITDMQARINDTANLGNTMSEQATRGEESLREMNSTMQTIIHGSREMLNIISIINDISDQINLLSLNASIEAARAGDSGRGFAVVADEISKLADQTTASVKDIDRLIKTNNDEIEHGITNVDQTVKVISTIIQGVNQINEMVSMLTDFMDRQIHTNNTVNDEANKVKDWSKEISHATGEQKTAADEIVKSVSSINELTQANASGAENMNELIEKIAEMARKLNNQVNSFQLE